MSCQTPSCKYAASWLVVAALYQNYILILIFKLPDASEFECPRQLATLPQCRRTVELLKGASHSRRPRQNPADDVTPATEKP